MATFRDKAVSARRLRERLAGDAGHARSGHVREVSAVSEREACTTFCSTSRIGKPSALRREEQCEHLLDQQAARARATARRGSAARLRHQAAADGEHLLLPAGQRAGALARSARAAAERVEERGPDCASASTCPPIAAELKILATVKSGNTRRPRAPGSAQLARWRRAGSRPSMRLPSKWNTSRRGRTDSLRERPVKRGLAHAVRSEHRRFSQSRRMSGMSCLRPATRSTPRPNANPDTFSAS